ncbi:MAG: carboxypeptidase regulatory-like domain-containing protein [Bacteroidales bacterium]|nr:carboxypeptidase regulatory-like domain-containing protein [Bacteroidales bacterium]MBR5029335.1 carboxypeptidase regulatory-like domain-containing protein [Bacteroidales bacterium]
MKKNFLISISALIISAFALSMFVSCDKETDCTLSVVVLDEENNNAPKQGVTVKVAKDNSEVNVEGVTDANGRFKATFKAPAIFDVIATFETGESDPATGERFYREGKNSVRLEDGQTVECSVILLKDRLRHY